MFRRPALTIFFLFVLSLTSIQAQEESQPATPPEAAAVEEAVSQEGNVSLDFRDADIQNVLRILSYKSGVNIVAGPDVTGLVTIKLTDVPWKTALEVILETYGYGYERKGNIISVTTVENLKKRREDAQLLSEQEPLLTKTFILNYAKAADIIESVEKMKTDRGSVNYDERTNSIIIRDIEMNINLMADVLEKLDQTTPQVLIEAKVVETTLNNTENLGIDWTTKMTFSGATRPSTWPFTTSSENKYFKGDDFPGADSEGFTYGTINLNQFQAVLEFLNTRTDTNVLSNPRIVTLDNKPAKIFVGQDFPIPNYVYNEDQARLQVNGFEFKEIGITFDVTPHVNNAGFVTIDLVPQVTAILERVTFESTQLPVISKEEAKTSVMVKSGDTIVIAGLIKDQVTEVKKKMPFLGDIPLLGLIFRKTEKSVVKTDLLIFLTPHIISGENPEGDSSQMAEK